MSVSFVPETPIDLVDLLEQPELEMTFRYAKWGYRVRLHDTETDDYLFAEFDADENGKIRLLYFTRYAGNNCEPFIERFLTELGVECHFEDTPEYDKLCQPLLESGTLIRITFE